MGENAAHALYLVLLLVLVGSSLQLRRLPVGQTAKMAGAWVAIFGGAFILFALRGDFSAIGQRVSSEIFGPEPVEHGKTLYIPMAQDGHFWVEAAVNGHASRFLVDSGASVTTVSRSTADEAGLETGVRREAVETANGSVVMKKSRAESFRVGPINRSDFSIDVTDRDEVNVVGMNFLSSLTRWSVEGNRLVLIS
ncbi:MAG: retropepsin-like aspartic protease [Sphingomicrobium sp.]